MGADRKGWGGRGAALGACLVLMALACLRPQPSGEGAPSSAPVQSPTPAPEAPAPAILQEPAEKSEEAPASGAADAVGGVGSGAAPPAPESKPKKSVASPRKSSRTGLSNPRDEEQPSAEDLRRRLDRAYAAASPDCPSARDRKKAVCDLATQICSLTERDPNVASVAEYCEEARRRCNDAERRTDQRCPE